MEFFCFPLFVYVFPSHYVFPFLLGFHSSPSFLFSSFLPSFHVHTAQFVAVTLLRCRSIPRLTPFPQCTAPYSPDYSHLPPLHSFSSTHGFSVYFLARMDLLIELMCCPPLLSFFIIRFLPLYFFVSSCFNAINWSPIIQHLWLWYGVTFLWHA